MTSNEHWKMIIKEYSNQKRIKKLWYIYTMDYCSAIRKDEILLFVTTWTDGSWDNHAKWDKLEKVENHMISLMCEI